LESSSFSFVLKNGFTESFMFFEGITLYKMSESLVPPWNFVQECIHKFADWVDNEIYAYNNKHSLRGKTKGYGGRTH
jgi:hypothetical protein